MNEVRRGVARGEGTVRERYGYGTGTVRRWSEYKRTYSHSAWGGGQYCTGF